VRLCCGRGRNDTNEEIKGPHQKHKVCGKSKNINRWRKTMKEYLNSDVSFNYVRLTDLFEKQKLVNCEDA
jgi:hypothetical protein